MDEIDAIGGRRFSEGTSADREIQRTLMELLNQLDGFDQLGKVSQRVRHEPRVITSGFGSRLTLASCVAVFLVWNCGFCTGYPDAELHTACRAAQALDNRPTSGRARCLRS
jgi:hypothetical protein